MPVSLLKHTPLIILWFRVMSGIITGQYFQRYFDNPSALDLGTMVAVLEVGAFGAKISFLKNIGLIYSHWLIEATSIAAGRVGDIIGRRGTLLIGAIVFTIGGAIQTFTIGFWSMVVGRIVSGFGVGLLS